MRLTRKIGFAKDKLSERAPASFNAEFVNTRCVWLTAT